MPPATTNKYTPEQVNAINTARETNIAEGKSAYEGAGKANQINSVSMGSLTTPPTPIDIPQPKLPTPPTAFAGQFEPVLQQAQDGIIRAQTEEAAKRDDILGRLLDTEVGSSQDVYNKAFTQAGGDTALSSLQDATTRLAQLQGKFRTGAQAVSGAKGQSKVFEGVQLGELSRQEAIEVGNQALVVQALQGNFESARQIALDTSNFAIEDRKAELDNLYKQYQAIGTVVANQEAQLIDKERRRLDTLQESVNAAITSGGASVEEMQQLTNPNTTDDQKLATAQSIVARTARQDLALDRSVKGMQMRKSLIELAKAGDTNAIKQLGYDPNQFTPEALEEQNLRENALTAALDGVQKTQNMLDKRRGLEIATTNFGGFGRFFSKVGGIAVDALWNNSLFASLPLPEQQSALTATNDFLSDAEYVLENLTLDKLGKLETPLTPVSNADMATVRKASSKLAALADTKTVGKGESAKDKLTGFKGDPELVVESILELQDVFERNANKLLTVSGMSAAELQEVNNLMINEQ